MGDKATIYCDESGNDGPNYLNPQQPFYVLAGWVVPDDRIVDATAAVEATRQRECRDAGELKFKTFKKSEGKREALISLVCEIGGLGLIPVFLFAEKRFCITGKIVETFLDPYYNPLVRNGLTWDVQTKQELANTLYKVLPETTLRKFAEAYQRPTEAGLLTALLDVVEKSRSRVNPEIAAMLEGSRTKMSEIVAAEIVAAESYEKAAGTLNFPCLVTFMMLVEHLARKNIINPHRLVHDEQGPYQAGYEQVFIDHRHAAEHWVTLVGQDVPYGALRAIQSFETQRSVHQPLIQAADLLAGTINHVCTKLQAGQALTAAERRLAQLSLPLMLVPNLRLAWPICSDRMLRRIGVLFHEAFGAGATVSPVGPGQSAPSVPLPVFPVVQAPEGGPQRFPVNLPLFGIARVSDGAIMIALPPERAFEETKRVDRFIPLYTSESTAQQFLEEEQTRWAEPHEVRRFDVRELPELFEQLDAWGEYAAWVVLDPFCEVVGRIDVHEFAGTMRGIIDRIERAIRSGAFDVLLQHHTLNGREAISLLLSSGQYGAAWKDDHGTVHTGTTRDAALDSLQRTAAQSG